MSEPVTIIGQHMRVAGKLTGSEDLSVFGNVEGSIELTESLLVEATGVVQAEVKVRSAIISGVVVGNIVAEEMVEITSDGRMVGDIIAPRVILTDGAAFRGRIEMTGLEGAEDAPRSDARGARPSRDRSAGSTRAYTPRPAAPARPAGRPAESSRPGPRPAGGSAQAMTSATATATVTEVEELVEDNIPAPSDDLLSVADFRELGWNKCRSYIKARDINLEYAGFDELVDAYEAHLASLS